MLISLVIISCLVILGFLTREEALALVAKYSEEMVDAYV